MKALYLEKKYDLYVKEVEEPKPRKKHGIVKVKMSGVCGTDVHSFSGNNANTIYPLVIGHEAVGTIEQIEENEKGLKAGDRVVMEPYMGCGECFACRRGRYNACKNLQTYGVHRDGMMEEKVSIPVEKIYKLPDSITDEQACMIEPFAIGIHAVHRAEVEQGEVCLIIGAGAIGLICGMIVKVYGGTPVFFDPVDERLEKAKEMGFEHVYNNVKGNPVPYLEKLTGGDMPSVIFECSGAKPVLENLHQYISQCGKIVLIGWPHVPFSEIDTGNITRKELTILGSRNSSGCFEESIDLVAHKKVNADSFISHIVTMEEAKETLEDMLKNPGKYMKVIIKIQ